MSAADIGRGRAEASAIKLKELNPHTKVTVFDGEYTTPLQLHVDVVCVSFIDCLDYLVEINSICREKEIPLIIGGAPGLTAFCFGDFGATWTSPDPTAEPIRSVHISNVEVSQDALVSVSIFETSRMTVGDTIVFSDVEGMVELNSREFQVTSLAQDGFRIGSTMGFSEYKSCAKACTVKRAKTFQHRPFSDFGTSSDWVQKIHLADEANFQKRSAYVIFVKSLAEFKRNRNRMPKPHSPEDAAFLLSIAATISPDANLSADFITKATLSSAGELAPLASIVGGLLAQESIKAICHYQGPIDQWLFFDYMHLFAATKNDAEAEPVFVWPTEADCQSKEENRYSSYISVFGTAAVEALQQSRHLLFGAGSIGSEVLKNFALLGIGAAKGGEITIVDNGRLKSRHLPHQSIYRRRDVGALKAKLAALAATSINPAMNIRPEEFLFKEQKIGDSEYWARLASVCNTLDTDYGRGAVSRACIDHLKKEVDAGRDGTKGHVHVTLPFHSADRFTPKDFGSITAPMSSSSVPFSANPMAGILWARQHIYETHFVSYPGHVNAALSGNRGDPLRPNCHAILEALEENIVNRETSILGCAEWARKLLYKFFYSNQRQLLHLYPRDSLRSDETPFWSNGLTAPTPVLFDPESPACVNFILAAAFIRAKTLRLIDDSTTFESFEQDRDQMIQAAAAVEFEEWKPPVTRVQRYGKDEKNQDIPNYEQEEMQERIMQLIPKEGPNVQELRMRVLDDGESDSDDGESMEDNEDALRFLHAAIQLRSLVHARSHFTPLEMRAEVCKILPAIISSSAVAGGLATLECLSGVLRPEYDSCRSRSRNSFFNLALEGCGAAQAQPALPKIERVGNRLITCWDRIDIKGRATMTIGELNKLLAEEYNIGVEMIGCGVILLWAQWSRANRLDVAIIDQYKQRSKQDPHPDQDFLVLDITGIDATTGADLDSCEPVHFHLK